LNFFNARAKPTFFITKNFDVKLHEKSNLVLSPEFYWAKRVSLNVRFKHEVKQMAPSIFTDLLPDGNFEFKVSKISQKEYVIVAYDLAYIKKELAKLGIDMLHVDRIYTAQSEFLYDEISLRIDDNNGLVSKDNIIVFLPLQYLDTHSDVHSVIGDKKLSYDYIYSHKFQKANINPKQLNLVTYILIFCILIVVLDFIKLAQDKSIFEEQKEVFIKSNNFPRTKIQLKSMQDELSLVDTLQHDIRESLLYIDKFRLDKTEYFSMMKLEKNKIIYKIKFDDKKRESLFNSYLSKKNKDTILIEKAK